MRKPYSGDVGSIVERTVIGSVCQSLYLHHDAKYDDLHLVRSKRMIQTVS